MKNNPSKPEGDPEDYPLGSHWNVFWFKKWEAYNTRLHYPVSDELLEMFKNKNGKSNRAIYVNNEPILFIQSKHLDKGEAICTAVNNTYGKGYNPAAMEELYKALNAIMGEFRPSEEEKEYNRNAAVIALQNAKLNP